MIAAVLIAVVAGTLAFADSYTIHEAGRRCATNFGKTKWPMYLGCAMTAHEDLAAGLIGGAGALFAAWIAFDAVQEQLGEERKRQHCLQVEAKVVAVTVLTELIAEAALTLNQIEVRA